MLSLLQEKGHMKIEELAEHLYVSPSTVRRKLSELQEKGLVTRMHGGVRINDENNFFPSFTFRSHQNSLEKKKIALAAVRLIKNGDLIFLDGSTSAFSSPNTCPISKHQSGDQRNRYPVPALPQRHRSLLDGRIRLPDQPFGAYRALRGRDDRFPACRYHFFSAQSVGKNGEVYDCFEEENVLRRKMLQHSEKRRFMRFHQIRKEFPLSALLPLGCGLHCQRPGYSQLSRHQKPAGHHLCLSRGLSLPASAAIIS